MTTVASSDAPAELGQTPLQIRAEEHWPFYDADELQAVERVLLSGRVNQWTGPEVFAFEAALARYVGVDHAIALANGSLALELALRAFDVGPGDEVIVTPRSFVASASCVRLVGATPVFADVDPDSGNITARSIAQVITERTRAIIPVHLAGWPCDMPAIMDLAARHGLRVIEDCAQAHGAEIGGRPVGSFGDAAAFSFCQDKIMSTGGEGGATLFRDEALYKWAWSFKDHGKDRDKALARPSGTGFRWLHDRVGTNWRMMGIQAAIGSLQLEKLDGWREQRTARARIWHDALSQIEGVRIPMPEHGTRHAFYKFYFYLKGESATAERRDSILAAAAESGLRVFSGSCSEVYREHAFDDLPQVVLPVAKGLGEVSLMVEVHPTLDEDALRARAARLAQIVRSTAI